MFKKFTLLFAFISLCACTHTKNLQNIGDNKIISLHEFEDAISHYRAKKDKFATYSAQDFVEIADNIVLLQRENGGWAVNQDPTKIFNEAEIKQLKEKFTSIETSFDNRNIYSQIKYLMEAYEKNKNEKYLKAAISGINFTIKNQYNICGGWPHSIPSRETYHDKITIADEIMSGNLRNLLLISRQKYPYSKLPKNIVKNAKLALDKGNECLLKLQIKQNGKLLGWAGQYDKDTLLPSMGRKFELPSIVSQETVEILKYLMEIENPSPEQIIAIESGIEWLKNSAIKGYRLETYKLEKTFEFQYHNIDFDRRLVLDDNAPLLWARFYDLNDNSIVLANRDSIRVDSYDKIHIERRTGYNWFGYWPQKLLEKDYINWKSRLKR